MNFVDLGFGLGTHEPVDRVAIAKAMTAGMDWMPSWPGMVGFGRRCSS